MTINYSRPPVRFRRMHLLRKTLLCVGIVTAFMLILNSCNKPHDHVYSEIVYVETNDYHDNHNAILAYRHKGDGKPEQIPGSPFYTHGAGLGNPTQALGPDDTETPLMIFENKYLLAVNSGSNSIAVFRIRTDGSLDHVSGSPFKSGGENPVSLSAAGNHLYVVNKGVSTKTAPNYATFIIEGDGSLTHVPGGKFETYPGSSPAQAFVSNDRKFVFGADFLSFMLDPAQGTLRSFTRNNSGTLTPVAGTPYVIPGTGGALGLWQHPHANVLYVGFPLQGKLGIYSIDPSSGALTFKSTVDGGPATCWIRVTKNGKYLYTLNSGENTISVFNSSDPLSLAPVEKFTLRKSGPLYAGPAPGTFFTTSEDFHLSLSKSEKYLYVVSQHTNKDFSIGNYNYLHTLAVGEDGRLTEAEEPVQLPVAADIRPQGVAVY